MAQVVAQLLVGLDAGMFAPQGRLSPVIVLEPPTGPGCLAEYAPEQAALER